MDDLNNATIATAIPSPVSHQKSDPTSSTPSMFPTETYERIIDFLAYETLKDLSPEPRHIASCCLTSRLWFPRSRFHLYFNVELGSRPQLEAFVRCTGMNPSNSNFVRRLVLDTFSDNEGWVSAVPLALAPKLKNLSTLAFYYLDSMSVHPSFSQHLSTFSTLPELEFFDGEFCGLSLIRTISAFPRLQKLRCLIDPLSDDDDDDEAAATLALARRKKPLPLRHLSLSTNAAPILLPVLVAARTPLTMLRFELYDRYAEEAELALQSVGSFLSSCHTLRTIRLVVFKLNGRVVCPHLSFSSLPNLHRLLLDIVIAGVEDISAVVGLLSTISAHSLPFLQLNLDITRRPRTLKASAPWEVLNEALLLPNVRLTREIAISMGVGNGAYHPEEEVLRLLPALKTMNVVNRWSVEHFDAFWNKL